MCVCVCILYPFINPYVHHFQDDIGLGAVVGSAVFNIMFVISVCALFAGQVSTTVIKLILQYFKYNFVQKI